MFETTIAGSLPKPAWLAEPNKLWPAVAARRRGAGRGQARRDAAVRSSSRRTPASTSSPTASSRGSISCTASSSTIDGIDFDQRVKMGIRNNRYEAMVPTVTGALRLRRAACTTPRPGSRARTPARRLKFTLPGPMTIVDTIADAHYGDRVEMAMAFAELLNEEARELEADGVDVIQFDEPAFNVYMDEVGDWGIAALHRADRGPDLHDRRAYLLRLRHPGEHRLEGQRSAREWRQYETDLPGAGGEPDRPGLARMRATRACRSSCWQLLAGKDVLVGVIDVATDRVETPEEVAADDRARRCDYVPARAAVSLHQLRHGADAARYRRGEACRARRRCRARAAAACGLSRCPIVMAWLDPAIHVLLRTTTAGRG